MAGAGFRCHMLSTENTPTLPQIGAGNGSFHRGAAGGIAKQGSRAVIMSTSPLSKRRLADEDTDPKSRKILDEHIEWIRSTLQKHGKSLKPDRPSLFQMAKEVGLENEYQTLYGIYSKYVHASP